MKKEYWISGAAVLVAIAVVITLFFVKNSTPNPIVELDRNAEDNTAIVEPAKEASASVHTDEQTLNIRIGALKDAKTPQLQIAEILVDTGQRVQSGTPLLRLTTDSVKTIRTSLQKEVLDTSKTYELLRAKQKEQRLQVEQTYDTYIANGKYSNTIYHDTCSELQAKTDAAKEAVDNKQNEVNENLLTLSQLQQDLANAQHYLKEAQTAVSENYKDRFENAYYYAVYENTRETAQGMVAQLEEQIELHTEQNETLMYEVDEAVRAYHQAMLDQEKEKQTAALNRDTEVYYSQVASEWRDIQTADLDHALQEAQTHYETALQNIRDFDAHIVRNRILSEHNGIISDIMVAPGDNVMPSDTLIIFATPAQP